MNPLRAAHPLARLILFLALSLSAGLAGSYPALLLLNGCAVLLLALTRPEARLVWLAVALFAAWLPGSAVLFALAGWETAGEFVPGLLLGLDWLAPYLLRILCIILANVALINAVTAREFFQSLRRCGLPPKLVLFAVIVVRFLPVSLEEAKRIIDVQRCRGFKLKGLMTPKNFLPILTPILIGQMKRAHDMALCLEIRHFFWAAPRERSRFAPRLADLACFGLACAFFAVSRT